MIIDLRKRGRKTSFYSDLIPGWMTEVSKAGFVEIAQKQKKQ